MRVCGLDIETTGLEHSKDHVTELGWVIKDIGDPKPLVMKSRFCELPDGVVLTDEIRNLTKITPEHCAHGAPFFTNMSQLCADLERFKVDYIVAHNGENFDKPFLQARAQMLPGATPALFTELFDRPWLDTKEDCVYPPDCFYSNLMYVAAYFGFLNPFPHAALFDAMTTLKVLEQFDVAQVVERARHPWVVVKALTSYEERHLAKARRYFWETLGTKTYPKQWIKKVKECDLEKEIAEAPFKVVKIA